VTVRLEEENSLDPGPLEIVDAAGIDPTLRGRKATGRDQSRHARLRDRELSPGMAGMDGSTVTNA
jgi:hypothetical protein